MCTGVFCFTLRPWGVGLLCGLGYFRISVLERPREKKGTQLDLDGARLAPGQEAVQDAFLVIRCLINGRWLL